MTQDEAEGKFEYAFKAANLHAGKAVNLVDMIKTSGSKTEALRRIEISKNAYLNIFDAFLEGVKFEAENRFRDPREISDSEKQARRKMHIYKLALGEIQAIMYAGDTNYVENRVQEVLDRVLKCGAPLETDPCA